MLNKWGKTETETETETETDKPAPKPDETEEPLETEKPQTSSDELKKGDVVVGEGAYGVYEYRITEKKYSRDPQSYQEK